MFETGYMSRPLPRREFSVRSDYKLLMGKESLIITSKGWFHEQRNFKHRDNLEESSDVGPFVARRLDIIAISALKISTFLRERSIGEETQITGKMLEPFGVSSFRREKLFV